MCMSLFGDMIPNFSYRILWFLILYLFGCNQDVLLLEATLLVAPNKDRYSVVCGQFPQLSAGEV